MFETGAGINLLKMWVYWIKELIWKLCMIDSAEAVIVFITPFSCRICNSLPCLEITFPGIHSDTRSSPSYEDRVTEQSSGHETTLNKEENTSKLSLVNKSWLIWDEHFFFSLTGSNAKNLYNFIFCLMF